MTIEIKVPSLGESVTEATVAKWLKQPGEAIERDEPVVELETDKVTLEIPAPAAGTLGEIRAAEGSNVPVGAVLGVIADGVAAGNPSAAAGPSLSRAAGEGGQRSEPGEGSAGLLERSGPAVRKLVADTGIDARQLTATGRGGRITKSDVIAAHERQPSPSVKEPSAEPVPAPPRRPPAAPTPARREPPGEAPLRESRVRMTRLRRRIAERLKEAQNTA